MSRDIYYFDDGDSFDVRVMDKSSGKLEPLAELSYQDVVEHGIRGALNLSEDSNIEEYTQI